MTGYLNCNSGICGSMVLGALIDAGLPLDYLKEQLARLNIAGWDIVVTNPPINGIKTTHIHIQIPHEHHHRTLSIITDIINSAKLPDFVTEKSIKAFSLLARAEAEAHGTTVEKVHFHEVGAVDAIIDIVGSFIGMDYFNVNAIYATPVNLGGGTAKCAHGVIPVPSPAVQRLLKGIPVFSSTNDLELTTPTGAAILMAMDPIFTPYPTAMIKTFGYGSGTYRTEEGNILSLTIMEEDLLSTTDSIVEIETTIDDQNPELYEHIMESLMQAGALDVTLTQVIMKKSRPGIVVKVLCRSEQTSSLAEILFRESTSFGLRYSRKQRLVLDSRTRTISTPWGEIPFRIGKLNGKVITIKPEYDVCKKLAQEFDIPLKTLYRAVIVKGEEYYGLYPAGRKGPVPEAQG